MSEPLSLSGRRQSQLPSIRASAAEYLHTRKKPSAVVAVGAGSGTMGTSNNNLNSKDDYDGTHPLPAPPVPTHSGLNRHHVHEQEQEEEQDQEHGQEQEQDEPLSLQFASSTSRINNTTSHQQKDDDLPDIPPPLPSKKTFYVTHQGSDDKKNKYSYNYTPPSSSPTFLENFMSRHPKISRHRRRFAALLFTIGFLFLLLITLLAVLLTRRHDGFNGGLGGGDGGGGLGQPGNEWGDGATATMEELRKYNAGKSPAPINHSNEPGWTKTGQGEGTFYGKW